MDTRLSRNEFLHLFGAAATGLVFASMHRLFPRSNAASATRDQITDYAPAFFIRNEGGMFYADEIHIVGTDGNAFERYALPERIYFPEGETPPVIYPSSTGNHLSCLYYGQDRLPMLIVMNRGGNATLVDRLNGNPTGVAWRNSPGLDELVITSCLGDATSIISYVPGNGFHNITSMSGDYRVRAASKDISVLVHTNEKSELVGGVLLEKHQNTFVRFKMPIADITSKCITKDGLTAYVSKDPGDRPYDSTMAIRLVNPHGNETGEYVYTKHGNAYRNGEIRRCYLMPRVVTFSERGMLLMTAHAGENSTEDIVSDDPDTDYTFVHGIGKNPIWLENTHDLFQKHYLAYITNSDSTVAVNNTDFAFGTQRIRSATGFSRRFGCLTPFKGSPNVLFYDDKGTYHVL